MAYLFRQKLNVEDLAIVNNRLPRVLIYEPESYLSLLYAHYLQAHNFDIKHCPNLLEIKEQLEHFSPQILIFNSDHPQSHLNIKSLVKAFPSLHIVTTGSNLNNESITGLMEAGVSGHINRKFSQPQDLVTIVNNILNN